MNQSRTKGNNSEFFLSFQAPWEEPGMEPKRRGVLLKKTTTLFGFDEKEREKEREGEHEGFVCRGPRMDIGKECFYG